MPKRILELHNYEIQRKEVFSTSVTLQDSVKLRNTCFFSFVILSATFETLTITKSR